MNKEELGQQLIVLGDKLLKYLESGMDFVVDQAPQVLQEYLKWFAWWHTVWGWGWAVVAAVLFICTIAMLAKCITDSFDDDTPWPIVGAFSTLATLGTAMAAVYNFVMVAKVNVAPRLIALEAIQRLLRGYEL